MNNILRVKVRIEVRIRQKKNRDKNCMNCKTNDSSAAAIGNLARIIIIISPIEFQRNNLEGAPKMGQENRHRVNRCKNTINVKAIGAKQSEAL